MVVLNDWARLSEVVKSASDAGVPTFAKVEGVQDFDDVDTGRERRPYRAAAVILGQGQNDADALTDKGLGRREHRLERIWPVQLHPEATGFWSTSTSRTTC